MTPERRASLHAEAESLANIGMGGVAASIVEALDALDAAEASLKLWHAECDAVGIPHSPDLLVLHHRANAALAARLDERVKGQEPCA